MMAYGGVETFITSALNGSHIQSPALPYWLHMSVGSDFNILIQHCVVVICDHSNVDSVVG